MKWALYYIFIPCENDRNGCFNQGTSREWNGSINLKIARNAIFLDVFLQG